MRSSAIKGHTLNKPPGGKCNALVQSQTTFGCICCPCPEKQKRGAVLATKKETFYTNYSIRLITACWIKSHSRTEFFNVVDKIVNTVQSKIIQQGERSKSGSNEEGEEKLEPKPCCAHS